MACKQFEQITRHASKSRFLFTNVLLPFCNLLQCISDATWYSSSNLECIVESSLCFSQFASCSRAALWKHLLKTRVAPSTSSFVENALRHKEPSPGGCIAWTVKTGWLAIKPTDMISNWYLSQLSGLKLKSRKSTKVCPAGISCALPVWLSAALFNVCLQLADWLDLLCHWKYCKWKPEIWLGLVNSTEVQSKSNGTQAAALSAPQSSSNGKAYWSNLLN